MKNLGIGISTSVGIGGDPINGSSFKDIIEKFETDDETDAISLVLGFLVVWDTDIWKFLFWERSFTNVVLPAPDGDDKITIIPSFFLDI